MTKVTHLNKLFNLSISIPPLLKKNTVLKHTTFQKLNKGLLNGGMPLSGTTRPVELALIWR